MSDGEEIFSTPNPFKKSTLLARSPSDEDRDQQKGDSTFETPCGKGRKANKKRKAEESPLIEEQKHNGKLSAEENEGRTLQVANKTRAMLKCIKELSRLIMEHPNTKLEIKAEIVKLEGCVKAMTEENIFDFFQKDSGYQTKGNPRKEVTPRKC